ncbi:MAG: protein kinase [Verrucomicrobiae bacterium]|nr:protein kinase [Verrucomicrobiae bacterium]
MSDGGRPFGPFNLSAVVADTRVGPVYRAQHVPSGQPAAVLLLDRRAAEDKEYLKRFFRQAKAAAKLDHPHLAAVIEAGDVKRQYYLATEWVEGSSVAELLRIAGPLPEKQAVEIARACVLALKTAWEKAELTHGGITIDEIIVQPDGGVKLCGLALASLDESSRIGDLRALGAALYQMLVNEPPPPPGHRLPDLAGKRPELSPHVGEVVEKMMAEPRWNYSGYDPLIEDLEALLEGRRPRNTEIQLSLGAAGASSGDAQGQREWVSTAPQLGLHKTQRRASRLGGLIQSLVMLAIVAAAGWWLWQYLRSGAPETKPVSPAPTPTPAAVPVAAAPAAVPTVATPATTPPKSALPTFEEIADLTERGRAMAKFLGAQRLQSRFKGALTVLEDGQIKWSYTFDRADRQADFSAGSFAVRDRALHWRSGEVAFKSPLRGDVTIVVEGALTAADAGAAWTALAVRWQQESGREHAFGFTPAGAELSEIVNGQRAVLDTKPFTLRAGERVRYIITQRGSYCVVTVTGGPMIEGRFRESGEGALSLGAKDCACACASLEITGTVPAAWLRQHTE